MSESGKPLKVFVSHIHEEAVVAGVLKEWLEDAFQGWLTVFVSSDVKDNPGGKEWISRVKAELTDPQLRVLVSLLSPESVRAPWISVELGAVWAQGRDVFPVLHSGQVIDGLPRPMQDFGGASLANDDAVVRLIAAVRQATGLSAPSKWDFAGFLHELRGAADSLAQRKHPASSLPVPARGGPDLPSEQVALLQILARDRDIEADDKRDSELASEAGLKISLASHHLGELVERGFGADMYSMFGRVFRISDEGTGWLIAHDKLPG